MEDDTFLHNLPIHLHPRNLIPLEVTSYVLDSLLLDYATVCAVTNEIAHGSHEVKASHRQIIQAISSSWNIITNLHILSKVLPELRFGHPLMAELTSKLSEATYFRNRLHHLHSNIQNISLRKKASNLFGSLSFCALREDYLVHSESEIQYKRLRAISVCWGKPKESMNLIVTGPSFGQQIEYPTGWFQLAAFGRVFDISEAVRDVKAAQNLINTEMKDRVNTRLTTRAIEQGVDPAIVISQTGSSFVFVADVDCA